MLVLCSSCIDMYLFVDACNPTQYKYYGCVMERTLQLVVKMWRSTLLLPLVVTVYLVTEPAGAASLHPVRVMLPFRHQAATF